METFQSYKNQRNVLSMMEISIIQNLSRLIETYVNFMKIDDDTRQLLQNRRNIIFSQILSKNDNDDDDDKIDYDGSLNHWFEERKNENSLLLQYQIFIRSNENLRFFTNVKIPEYLRILAPVMILKSLFPKTLDIRFGKLKYSISLNDDNYSIDAFNHLKTDGHIHIRDHVWLYDFNSYTIFDVFLDTLKLNRNIEIQTISHIQRNEEEDVNLNRFIKFYKLISTCTDFTNNNVTITQNNDCSFIEDCSLIFEHLNVHNIEYFNDVGSRLLFIKKND